MWNSLERVAESQLLDVDKFSAFALANTAKYGIDHCYVSNWHVDTLINDYRASRDSQELLDERDAALRVIEARYNA